MTNFTRFLCGVAAVWALAPAAAQAQQAPADKPVSELSIEQLMSVEVGTVFGASRYGQRVIDAPAAVSIVTHEEIDRFGYRTLGDVLRGVRGFYVTNDRNYSYLGVRGFSRPGDYNTRVLVLVDGHRLNEIVFDSSYIGEDFSLPMSAIERVEVIRGPGSSVYGTTAFFAVVNVVTKTALAIRSLEATVEGGSLGMRGGEVLYGRETAPGSPLVLAGSVYAAEGEGTIVVPGLGLARDLDDEQAVKAFAARGFGHWLVKGSYAWRTKRIPTGAFGTDPADPRSRTRDERSFLDLSYDGKFRGTGVFFRTAFDHYAYDGRYAYFPAIEGDATEFSADTARGDWWTTEAMLSRRVARRHFLTAGLEYRNNFRHDQDAQMLEPVLDHYLSAHGSSQVFAAYAQDEITLSSRLTVTAGLRHDRNGDLGSTNVRLAAIYKPADRSALKLLYGSAFRAPNPYELFYYANPAPLTPERIKTTEAVWEQYVGRGLRTSASAFFYNADDLITQVAVRPGGGLDDLGFANLDNARARGFELEAEATWREIHLLGSYTHQNVDGGEDRQQLSNSPRNMFRSRVTGPLFRHTLFYGVEGLYTGDRHAVRGGIAEGVLLGNVTLSTRELSRARLSITIGNLFNRHYGDPGAEEHPADIIDQLGRTMRARLTWRF